MKYLNSLPQTLQEHNAQMVYISYLLVGAKDGDQLRRHVEFIFGKYNTRNRKYHNISHLHEGLQVYMSQESDTLPITKAKVILAYAYHDIVYIPGESSNEERSAQLWRLHASMHGIEEYRVDVVANAIRRTDHQSASLHGVEAWVSDLDLIRLAADPEQFDEYSRQVFLEYRVPRDKIEEAMLARKNALQKFLDRPSIYFTEIGESLEDKARANLRRIGCIDPRLNQPSVRPH